METVIPAAIIIGLLLLAMLTMTEQALFAQEIAAESWREMEERQGEWNRTSILPVSAETETDLVGSTITITISNDGDTKLTNFEQWDVIVQYDSTGNGDYDVMEWLSCGNEPLYNEWRVSEILPDAFDPDILNPGEEIAIKLRVSPPVTITGTAIIATPNGVTASTVFTR